MIVLWFRHSGSQSFRQFISCLLPVLAIKIQQYLLSASDATKWWDNRENAQLLSSRNWFHLNFQPTFSVHISNENKIGSKKSTRSVNKTSLGSIKRQILFDNGPYVLFWYRYFSIRPLQTRDIFIFKEDLKLAMYSTSRVTWRTQGRKKTKIWSFHTTKSSTLLTSKNLMRRLSMTLVFPRGLLMQLPLSSFLDKDASPALP